MTSTRRFARAWAVLSLASLSACHATQLHVAKTYAGRDTWRGLTGASSSVMNTEVSVVASHGNRRQLAAGWFASRLLSDPKSADLSLAASEDGRTNRGNVWLEFTQSFPAATVAIGLATRSATYDSGARPHALPSATEMYFDLSTAGSGTLSHKTAFGLRITHDESEANATFAQARVDMQPLILPLPYAVSVRGGGELGINLGGTQPIERRRFESAYFAERGPAYAQLSAGLTIEGRTFVDYVISGLGHVQRNIDPATKVVGLGIIERSSKWVTLTLSIGVPSAGVHE